MDHFSKAELSIGPFEWSENQTDHCSEALKVDHNSEGESGNGSFDSVFEIERAIAVTSVYQK